MVAVRNGNAPAARRHDRGDSVRSISVCLSGSPTQLLLADIVPAKITLPPGPVTHWYVPLSEVHEVNVMVDSSR
jgi:hypothetical protein